MELIVPVSQEILHQLRDLAKVSPIEVCGVIDSNDNIRFIKNVSNTPLTSFIFDKREYFSCMKAVLDTGTQIVCVFHTHPNGDHTPSKEDLRSYKLFKRNSLIVSSKGYTWLEYA